MAGIFMMAIRSQGRPKGRYSAGWAGTKWDQRDSSDSRQRGEGAGRGGSCTVVGLRTRRDTPWREREEGVVRGE